MNPSREDALFLKVAWRLLPVLFISYVVAYIDRVNVGFAKLQMLQDLQFSAAVYGLGSGIFFVGFLLFEIPSNLILHKVGARPWLTRIMVTWGLISVATLWVQTPMQFYVAQSSASRAALEKLPSFTVRTNRFKSPSRIIFSFRVKVLVNLPAFYVAIYPSVCPPDHETRPGSLFDIGPPEVGQGDLFWLLKNQFCGRLWP